MTQTGNKILELINSVGLDSSKITHALRELGDGKMQDGLRRIAEYGMKEGFRNGQKSGIGIGIGIGAVAVSVSVGTYKIVTDRIAMAREHGQEGKTIAAAFIKQLPDNDRMKEDSIPEIALEEE